MKFLHRYFLHEKGSVAVEFAMVSILFLGFLFGIIEFGRLFWTMNALQYAIESTARYALVNEDATNDDLEAYAIDSMSGVANSNNLTITTTQTMISGISFIEVDGTYVFTTMLPFISDSLGTYNMTAQSRIPYSL